MQIFLFTEYEYFEQRGGLARPTLLAAPGGGPGHPLPAGATLGGPGAPLLPKETAKLDNRHEEVSFRPRLITERGIVITVSALL